MAGDWIKMRADLHSHVNVVRIATLIDRETATVVLGLYRLAGWFSVHGKYGKVKADADVVDAVIGIAGFAEALLLAGWMVDHGSVLTLRTFCDVSTARKSLGAKLRAQVLAAGSCAKCGATSDLVIDHKTPIVRGGSCEVDNLQALCAPCNRRKGRKTMEEFVA
jgi:hypothetical protein